jgi:virulence-associated protein VagC
MLTKLVSVGNSVGIRIPKAFLHSYGVGAEMELISKRGQIILKPVKKETKPRFGWKKAFMSDLSKNKKVKNSSEKVGLTKSKFDQQEWIW